MGGGDGDGGEWVKGGFLLMCIVTQGILCHGYI